LGDTLALGTVPIRTFLDHDALRIADFLNSGVVLPIIAGWIVMIVAMMLPTSLPLIGMFHRMTRQRTDRALLISLVLAGYLLVWTLFGVIALPGMGHCTRPLRTVDGLRRMPG
jgi:predicted metal-binding membrane protein